MNMAKAGKFHTPVTAGPALKRAALLAMILVLAGCGRYAIPASSDQPGGGHDLGVWLLSDIQPRSPAERGQFTRAVEDINTVAGLQVGIMAGDLLQSHAQAADFEWLLRTRARSRVQHWYELAGNHDARNRDLYRNYFHNPSHYGVAVGNVLFLLLSDETPSAQTDPDAGAFAWWRDMVVTHPDWNIITVTHAQLRESGLIGSFLPSRTITDSSRFAAVLRDYPVVLWASGHSHLPHWLPGTASYGHGTGNTFFLNVAAIREARFKGSESRVLLFERGSRSLWIRSRNHTRGAFQARLDREIELRHPFQWDGSPPQLVLP